MELLLELFTMILSHIITGAMCSKDSDDCALLKRDGSKESRCEE